MANLDLLPPPPPLSFFLSSFFSISLFLPPPLSPLICDFASSISRQSFNMEKGEESLSSRNSFDEATEVITDHFLADFCQSISHSFCILGGETFHSKSHTISLIWRFCGFIILPDPQYPRLPPSCSTQDESAQTPHPHATAYQRGLLPSTLPSAAPSPTHLPEATREPTPHLLLSVSDNQVRTRSSSRR